MVLNQRLRIPMAGTYPSQPNAAPSLVKPRRAGGRALFPYTESARVVGHGNDGTARPMKGLLQKLPALGERLSHSFILRARRA